MATVEIPAHQVHINDEVMLPGDALPHRIVSRRIQGAPAVVSLAYEDVPGRTEILATAQLVVRRNTPAG